MAESTSELAVSVLITCSGRLEHTRLCVSCLLASGREGYELIFIDVASMDGTAAYLAGLADANVVPVKVFRAGTDGELAAACSQALAAMAGSHLLLLNNDTLVSSRWLQQMVALANLWPELGLVGPMTNAADPPQRVDNVPYRLNSTLIAPRVNGLLHEIGRPDTTPVENFAEEWHRANAGRWIETDRLGGFCLLAKRAVVDQLGLRGQESCLELFDAGNFSARARQAGYRLAVCGDLYVHNFATMPATKARVG